jgi:hypothetical protein
VFHYAFPRSKVVPFHLYANSEKPSIHNWDTYYHPRDKQRQFPRFLRLGRGVQPRYARNPAP